MGKSTIAPLAEVGGPDPTSPVTDSPAVLVEVPLANGYPPSEFAVHVDTHLTLEQSTVLRRLAHELDRKQARLKNNVRVVNTNAAVKWLLENVAAAAVESE